MDTAARPAARISPGGVRRRNIGVMIVDDSLTTRTVLSRTIERESDLEVVATANTAEQALSKLDEVMVDIVLLDLEMPGMGGLAALPVLLKKARGAKVMVVSALTQEGAQHTLSALSMGAVDTLLKPASGQFDEAYRAMLLEKLRALSQDFGVRVGGQATPPCEPPKVRKASRKLARVLAIGGSTGGIHALCMLLRNLPGRIGVPILVTQHLPASFVPVLARQIEIAASRNARVAQDRTLLEADTVLIAPADGHLMIERQDDCFVARIDRAKAKSGCMPSADPMFASVADVFAAHGLGIVLSGMGRDGAEGAARIVEAGGTMIAQDEQSSAVWGMPRAIAEAGLASAILPPDEIAQAVSQKTDIAAWN